MTATLSPQTLDALEADYYRLIGEAQKVKALLESNGRLLTKQASLFSPVQIRTHPKTNGSGHTGLREHIMAVVRSQTSVKPREVTKVLLARGYESKGATALGVRVSSEMNRLLREKRLVRRDGRYRIVAESVQEQSVGAENGNGQG